MSQAPEIIPPVSKKLKIFVIVLTGLTLIALVALFTKLASKPTLFKKNDSATHAIEPNQLLGDEYQAIGTRLRNSGLKEQAIDQFIEVWKLQKVGSVERANAAQTVGRLYADLNNCPEALVWLFRAEVSGTDKVVTPLIDACMAKVRSTSPGQ
jgi:hypothetical protein